MLMDPMREKAMLRRFDDNFDFHAQALKLRTYRQQLLASNVANADTPGYKAVDIDFARELRRLTAGAENTPGLRITHARHLQPAAGNPLGVRTLYRVPTQPSIDGNTVDMDVERSQFAENALRYETSLRFLNGQFKSILNALKTQ